MDKKNGAAGSALENGIGQNRKMNRRPTTETFNDPAPSETTTGWDMLPACPFAERNNQVRATTDSEHGDGCPTLRGASVVRYQLHDAQGDLIAVADENRHIQSSLQVSSLIPHPSASPYRWGGAHGYYADEDVGMYLMGLRWYDAFTGRFISRDPIGFAAGDMNPFRPMGNNPVNEVDPLGLDAFAWGTVTDIVQRQRKAEQMEQLKRDIATHKTQSFNLRFKGDELKNALLQGAAATADGLIPFGDPFEKYYDPNDEWLKWSKGMGQVAQTALLTAVGVGVVNKLGVANRLAQTDKLGKGSQLFGRAQFTTSGNPGVLNQGTVRLGWGWKGTSKAGSDVFRAAAGSPTKSRIVEYLRHMDIFY
jgi:RHS repeat-associated protein